MSTTASENFTPTPLIHKLDHAADPGSNDMKRSQSQNQEEVISKKKKIDPETPSTQVQSEGVAMVEKHSLKDAEKIEREMKKETERLAKEKERLEKQAAKELKKRHAMELKQEKEAKREQERKRKEDERVKKQVKRDEVERERIEKKRKAEEERAIKEAEREKKEAERDKKEAERKLAELERERAEQAKERAQSKISSFFQVGRKVTSSSPVPATTAQTNIDSQDNANTNKTLQDDYLRDFLPFFLLTSTILASSSGGRDPSVLEERINELDAMVSEEPTNNSTLAHFFAENAFVPTDQVKFTPPDQIVQALDSSTTTELAMVTLLERLSPIKHISFYENSKPPYVGTWCSSEHQLIHIPTSDPLNTSLTGFDYAYDSDLEWNKEEEDGEDVDNDDEDDEDDLMMEDDDIDDFVENNFDGSATRKFHSSVVVNKWNDGTNNDFFSQFSCALLVPDATLPMDPFLKYIKPTEIAPSSDDVDTSIASGDKKQSDSASPTKPRLLTAHKKVIVDGDIVKRLIVFVEENHDFTVGTLVELSQKEFKDYTKAVLRNTIQDIAAYDKKTQKWTIKEEAKLRFSS